MADGVVQQLVDALSDQLSRAVVVDDPELRPLWTSRHYGDEDEQRIRSVLQRDSGLGATRHILAQGVRRWREPGLVPADEGLGMVARLAAPVRRHGHFLGVLLVIDADGSLTATERELIGRTTDDIAAHLYVARLAADEERAMAERDVLDLLGDSATTRQNALSRIVGRQGPPPIDAARTTVTVIEVADASNGSPVAPRASPVPPGVRGPAAGVGSVDAEDALRTALHHLPPQDARLCLTSVTGGAACLVELWSSPPGAAGLRERTAALLRAVDSLCGVGRSAAGVGDDAAGLDDAWRACRQARIAVEAVRRVPGIAPAAVWSELGPYALLLQLPATAIGPDAMPTALHALRERDPAGRLMETLESFLDHAGSRPDTAQALHIHRTSLYYRLDRITEITGLNLDDGENRLTLHLALRAARLLRP
ncbi:helix-turn-helix domain-containing protein [Streptomyces sp. NPDC005373]|uniref:PucR family transcriptional regulator n=1 Tax=Streptomyces sp. NPDC005373 TaxID=3156879 RepID=UPI00339FC949